MASLGYGVYATYDRYGLIADYVVSQVAALAQQGYRVIFVSTSPCLLEREIAKMVPYSWKILHRRNLGYDFGSYKEGIRQVGSTEKAESLILMNDSAMAPCSIWQLSSSRRRQAALTSGGSPTAGGRVTTYSRISFG